MPSNQTNLVFWFQSTTTRLHSHFFKNLKRVRSFGTQIWDHVSYSKHHCDAVNVKSMSRVRGHSQPFPCRGSPHRRCPAPYLPAQNLPAMPFRQSADPELIVLGNFAKKNTAPKLKEKKYPPGWDFTFPKLGYVSSQEDKVFEWFLLQHPIGITNGCLLHASHTSLQISPERDLARLTTCKSEALTNRNKFNTS